MRVHSHIVTEEHRLHMNSEHLMYPETSGEIHHTTTQYVRTTTHMYQGQNAS
jgi:hypothetical protein